MIASPQRQSSRLRRSLYAVVAAAGGLLVAAGCSGGYDTQRAFDEKLIDGDALCAADMEPGQGDACTRDCTTATCAGGDGRRVCTCSGGVFLQCACLPPANWPYKDVPVAPYCDRITGQPRYLSAKPCANDGLQCISSTFPAQGCTCKLNTWQCGSSETLAPGSVECESLGSGLNPVLKGLPCDTDFELCVARDFNQSGTSPRGCYCNPENGQRTWACGGTNRWYRAP